MSILTFKLKSQIFCALLAVVMSTTLPSGPVMSQGRFGEAELLQLSNVLGGIHYLRSKCSRSEKQIWRERMQTLLKIEQPSIALEDKMVEEFNAAYKRQERKYSRCNRDAKDEAKRLAVEGQGLISRMTQALD